MTRVDVVVVGGGLVGLASAWQLLATHPTLSIAVLEKEAGLGQHQSGRSSGVLHSGVYYTPGSHKARLCREGRPALERLATELGVRWARTGKVLVATAPEQLARLDTLHANGLGNGVTVRRIGPERLAELEPHVRGIAALEVPEAGIADFRGLCGALGEALEARGVQVIRNTEVIGARREGGRWSLDTTTGPWQARVLLGAAGLHSDRLARMTGFEPDVRVVPFRGEYMRLVPEVADRCRTLIYPVPNPDLPFLGVHLTRDLDGGVTAGPNAVPALAREGYRWRDVSVRDLAETASWPGSWRLLRRHLSAGVQEVGRSLSPAWYAASVRELVPSIEAHHLRPAPAGVRAQAVHRDGRLVYDFVWERGEGVVHVLNAPSPAATCCLAIGREVAAEVARHLPRS